MKTINGQILKQMVVSGSNNLFNQYPAIDALNVFPVPDGDTGTNMNLTMTSGSKEVSNLNDTHIGNVGKSLSRGLLMGARGNSGVILSQIFRGFAQGLEGKSEVNVEEFAAAWVKGKEVAYKAVMRPVEGTMLTVIRESADALAKAAPKLPTIDKAMEFLIQEARKSLDHTPELLPILKEVGVVDSGGAGLLKILEGFHEGLLGRVITRREISRIPGEQPDRIAGMQLENDEFGYCTEFIIRIGGEGKKAFIQKRFDTYLNSQGNSIVVVRDEDLVKVHIHTLRPGQVMNYAQNFGEFVTLKIENMQEQHSHLHEKLDTPQKAEPLKFGLIAVAAGDGLSEMFRDLRVDYIVSGGQTMNPSTEDFVKAVKELNAKDVFILPNNKNILMAAQQASQVIEGCVVHVIPTTTIPQGLTACMMFNPEETAAANVANMTEAIKHVQTGQVTYAIKDTNIDGVEIRANEFMGFHEKKIVVCVPNKMEAAQQLLDQMVTDDTAIVTIIYGEEVTADEAQILGNYLSEKFSIDVEVHRGGQPVYSFIFSVE